ncbi:phosphatidate cytidylyltransferase [Brevundimonas sp. 2R-24]|uniref:Phosphatidate cytidylyltransferase n=1 Tax=Peiella sedimenti TaxID=3061083 RepID=A0ABT8SK11_9CAUL|nr:phosphatidate cytidylyltransferase [Caulobacteraceae bacterium XZ-24]
MSLSAFPIPMDAPEPLVWGLAGVLGVLLLGTAAALLMPRLKPGADHGELRKRVASWWVMILLIAAALLAGRTAVIALFALISFLALREFLSLAPLRREDRLVLLFAFLTIPVSYALIGTRLYLIYLVAAPVWFFLLASFLMCVIGQTKGYLARAAIIQWGVLGCVYALGYGAMLMNVPEAELPVAGAAGLVFFLLVMTELNDVLQYVCGRLFGRHKVIPAVSPNKTWEGLIGGWVLTGALIWLLAPVFTPLEGVGRLAMAFGLPLAGFAGDVTLSAIKRDLGVKDASGLIPGHGGVLDRVDSLVFTAPFFFHVLAFYALDSF